LEAPVTDRDKLNVYKRTLFSEIRIRVGEKYVEYLYGVNLHPGQGQVHFEDWRYSVLDWGRRTGKTICAAAEAVAELGLEDRRIWIVAPNYELTQRVFDYIYRWVVVEGLFGKDAVVKASNTRDRRYIEMAWGSFIQGKSAEAPDSLVGEQLDLIVFDECARVPEMIWLECLEPTTIDRQGRAMFISTPRGKNWFYEYFLRGFDNDTIAKGWIASNFKTYENPFTDRAWLESKRSETPDIVWRREYEGSFEDFGGLIYPEFRAKDIEDGGHLFDPRRVHLPPELTTYRGIDIGFRLPTACLWGKVDDTNTVWIYREYEEANTIHEDHAQSIKAASAESVYQTYISPDAARRFGNQSTADERAGSPLQVYRDNGIFARKAMDDVMPGIGIVARYLRASLEDNPEHPRLFISQDCPKLIKALETYQFVDVNSRNDLDQPDKPRKKDDHLPDALRYMLTARPRFLREWRGTEQAVYEDETARYGYQNSAFNREPAGATMSRRKPGRPKILGMQ
jgi:hypothetical protein